MKSVFFITLIVMVSSCSQLSKTVISESQSNRVVPADYGISPDNYQKILKSYLINNIRNYKEAKVEFFNIPQKMKINHLGDDYFGYRVCLSINEKKGEYFRGFRNHFFIINNDKIILHLFDSGLLTIPLEHCITRDERKQFYIDDIPDEMKNITIESMDDKKIQLDNPKSSTSKKTYILCNISNKKTTYVFNEEKNIFKSFNGKNIIEYSSSFNDAYVIATLNDTELTINRVSGNAQLIKNQKTYLGSCKLLDSRKF